eukprot:TRINITY_DN8325_c0_g4_i2.p1 TRINITY_DN8325_c0_g4~~TRINITY_DN8325_c0_g4_i2.p1  ORF type:complete len:781 (+),score=94.80 TRINITY_DN8325_c0_g4_i2:94-2343(+)
MCSQLCQRLFACVARPEDDAEELARKRLAAMTSIPSAAIAIVALLFSVQQRSGMTNGFVGGVAIGFVACSAAVVFLLVARRMPLIVLEIEMVILAAALICMDWAMASVPDSARLWPGVVLVNDLLLTINARRPVQWAVLYGAILWLLVVSTEDVYRWGLFDVENWVQPSDELITRRIQCTDPPCAIRAGGAGTAFCGIVCFLCVDYATTRSFADGQRQQKERVLAMVRVAQRVAACLVKFDLESAEAELDAASVGDESADLCQSFRSLLGNLAGYRPYLPQSCFEEEADAWSSFNDDMKPSGPGLDMMRRMRAEMAEGGLVLERADSVGTSAGARSSCRRSFRSDGASRTSQDSGLSNSGRLPSRIASRHGIPARLPSAGLDGVRLGPRGRHAEQIKRVTLLHCNRRGLLDAVAHAIGQDPGRRSGVQQDVDKSHNRGPSLAQWLAGEVEAFHASVTAQKGVVEALSADHLCASFGALRVLGAHRVAAVNTAGDLAGIDGSRTSTQRRLSMQMGAGLESLRFTSAVCTGVATIGDFGSNVAQRFMVIGGVSAFVHVVERAAAGWGTPVLIDSEVQSDCSTTWDCRLRKVLVFPKRGTTRPVGLWDVHAKKPDAMESSQGEWMYQLSRTAANPWDQYNLLVSQFAENPEAGLEAARRLAMVPMHQHPSGVELEVHQGIEGLAAVQVEVLCVVPRAAGVGRPTPLRAPETTPSSGLPRPRPDHRSDSTSVEQVSEPCRASEPTRTPQAFVS